MKVSFIVHQQTVLHDTEKFSSLAEWVDLLNKLGAEIAEYDLKIAKAKDDRIRRNKPMPQQAWKKLNNDRYSRLKEWRVIADALILVYPEDINFTANQFMRIVREEYEEIFKKVFPRAAVDPTRVLVSKEGRPK